MTARSDSTSEARRNAAPGGGAPPRMRARKGEGARLREEILDAAEVLLAEKGSVDRVSMRAIADRCGVTSPAIYLHFEDKEDLFFRCCNRRFVENLDRLTAAAASPGSVADRLAAIGRAYIEYGLERGDQYAVLFAAAPPPSLSAEEMAELPGAQALRLVAGLVTEGLESGELRAELDPEVTAIVLWAAVHGMVMVLNVAADEEGWLELPPSDQMIDTMVEMTQRGLLA